MSLTRTSQKWYPGEYRSSIGTCCTAPKKHAKYGVQTTACCSLHRNRATPRPGSQQSAHEAFSLRALFHPHRVRASAPAPIRPRADLAVPTHAVAAGRLQLPAPADLLRLWRRGDRTVRALGRRLDDARARVTVQSVRHVRHRQRARDRTARRALVPALALWPLARRQRFVSRGAAVLHALLPEGNR